MTARLEDLKTHLAGIYDLDRELGQGGMATVFLAQDVKHRRTVAVKVLHPELAVSLGGERFLREIEIVARLNHPNVLPLYDSGRAGTHLYYVMPFFEGASLRDRMDREGRLSAEDAVATIRDVARALDYAHEQGVVHRDIKPENIMLGRDYAVVTDFGIAKALDAAGSGSLTATGMTIGSPLYMSPEQVTGEPGIDGRCDLYSVGCVLYEMLAGEPPYPGGSMLSVMARHSSAPVPRLREVQPDLPEHLDHVAARLMAKDPADRFQSAADLLHVLDDLRRASPVLVAAPAAAPVSVVVLPFADLSPSRDQEYLGDGIAEDVRAALAKVDGLRVASRMSSLAFKGRDVEMADVSRRLGVSNVVSGTLQRVGDRIRISAELTDARGNAMWAERFDRAMTDVFAMQDDIARTVVGALKIRLSGSVAQGPLVKKRTDNIEAYQAYLKGRQVWVNREKGGQQRAIELFREAIALDPLYALPYAGLADAFNTLGAYDFMAARAALARTLAASTKALEIDPNLAEVHSTLGSARAHCQWDWQAAEVSHRRALELDPRYPIGHTYRALTLSVMGQSEQAVWHARRAVELDPLNPLVNTMLGSVYSMNRRHDEALAQLVLTLEGDPGYVVAQLNYAIALTNAGRWADALAPALASRAMPVGLALEGEIHGMLGHVEEANAVLGQLHERAAAGHRHTFCEAMVHKGLGEYDRMIALLADCTVERPFFMSFIAVAPAWDSVRGDPRFAAIVQRMGLPAITTDTHLTLARHLR